MPYIRQGDREWLTSQRSIPKTSGELNFLLTDTIERFVRQHGLCYGTINDVLGALEGAKLEFYRRVAAPYEDKKKEENGDVYAPRGD